MSFLHHGSSSVGYDLHSNDLFVDRISINPIKAVKYSFDIVIAKRYLIAKDPRWEVVYYKSLHERQLNPLLFGLKEVGCVVQEGRDN